MSDQFVNVRKYLHTLGKVLINFPSACQHFWTLSTMLLDSLQHDCGHLLQATSHILNITLIVTDIICVSEADPPSDDSVTTYGCSQIRSNNPAPHTHPMPHPLYIFRFSSI